MKTTRNFRLTENADKLLTLLANLKGVSRTAILEMLIRESASAHNLVIPADKETE